MEVDQELLAQVGAVLEVALGDLEKINLQLLLIQHHL